LARRRVLRDNRIVPTFWGEQVLPRLTDALLGNDAIGLYRDKVTRELSGDIVEIGFGSGLNISHYPAAVDRVIAIEPSSVARNISAVRVAASPVVIDFRGLDGQRLSLANADVDGALSTFTLCTIPDPQLALGEIMRVLKPGGQFAFLEHGISSHPRVARWQHWLNPLQKRFAGGCNLNRQIDALVTEAGFRLEWIKREELPGTTPGGPWGFIYYGVGTKPAD
jgi:ubiquinone/menaquinone biosynthesis C-methylase UbiE